MSAAKTSTARITPDAGAVTREDAEAAVRTLIQWAGDDPDREGVLGTPARVVRAYEEYFAGYQSDAAEVLERTFNETDGYDEMVANQVVGNSSARLRDARERLRERGHHS